MAADLLPHIKVLFADFNGHFALNGRLHPWWIVSFLMVGLIIYFFQYREKRSFRHLPTAFDFCLPRKYYLRRASLNDLLLALAGTVAFALFTYSLIKLDIISQRQRTVTLFGQFFDIQPKSIDRTLATDTLWMIWLFTAKDFGWFVSHFLFHRIPWLWPIHKVHHSADHLTLLTNFRFHPLEKLVFAFFQGVSLGFAVVAGLKVIGTPPGQIFYFSLPIMVVISGPLGLFRHSHIWISFGPWLSRFLISPAMHQLHHSDKPEHTHCNYGRYLAVWDVLCRTLQVPKKPEKLNFGLQDKMEQKSYSGFSGLLWKPLLAALRSGRDKRPHS